MIIRSIFENLVEPNDLTKYSFEFYAYIISNKLCHHMWGIARTWNRLSLAFITVNVITWAFITGHIIQVTKCCWPVGVTLVVKWVMTKVTHNSIHSFS